MPSLPAHIPTADSSSSPLTGGSLLAADRNLSMGAIVRVRIPAREVILATREPEGLSLHNVLSGTVARSIPTRRSIT
jgi:molybdate transport system ATP-binding protein